jgi:hypothetical protein
MNLTEQEKYTLIGSASGFVLSRVFGAGLFGSLVLVGIGGYAGYNSDKIKSFVASKSKNSLSHLAGGEKASEDDAQKMISLVNEKNNLNYSDVQRKRFAEQYTISISKKENDYLIKLLNKEQSTFTSDEKKLFSKLVDILKDIVIQKE